jgi:hypothetical protein
MEELTTKVVMDYSMVALLPKGMVQNQWLSRIYIQRFTHRTTSQHSRLKILEKA